MRDDRAMLARLGVLPPSPVQLGRMIGWRLSGRARRAVEEVTAAMRDAAAGATVPPTADHRP